MKKWLVLTIGVIGLVLNHSSTIVYGYEEAVAGFSLITENVNEEELKMWTTERVNFRVKSDINSDIIKTLDKRTEVKFINVIGDWTKVKYENQIGFIYSKYLKDKELPSLDFTDEEIEILERIVEAECTDCSIESKMNVASVIINRVISLDFPDDIKNVVFEDGQFSPISDKRYWKVEITDETIKAVKNVIKDGVTDKRAIIFCNKNDVKNNSYLKWFNELNYLFTDDSEQSFYGVKE